MKTNREVGFIYLLAGAAGFFGSASLINRAFCGLNRPPVELITLLLAGTCLAYFYGRSWARWLLTNLQSFHWEWPIGTLIIAVLLIALVIPTLPFEATHTLEIIATGQKNPASDGNEVEIITLTNADQPVPDYDAGSGWKNHNGILFFSQKQPAVLRYQIPIFGNANIDLKFRNTLRSGIVEVRWHDQLKTLDLYSSTKPSTTLHLQGTLTWQQATENGIPLLLVLGTFCDLITLWLLLLSGAWAAYQLPKPIVRTGAFLFPVLLIAGAIYNLNATFHAVVKYPRMPSDLLSYLLEDRLNLEFQVTLAEYYAGRVLIAPTPDALAAIEQPPKRFLTTGRLADVVYHPYPIELTERQKNDLQNLAQITLTSEKNPEMEMHILTTDPQPERPLCIKRWQQWIFIGPDNLLPDCGARP